MSARICIARPHGVFTFRTGVAVAGVRCLETGGLPRRPAHAAEMCRAWRRRPQHEDVGGWAVCPERRGWLGPVANPPKAATYGFKRFVGVYEAPGQGAGCPVIVGESPDLHPGRTPVPSQRRGRPGQAAAKVPAMLGPPVARACPPQGCGCCGYYDSLWCAACAADHSKRGQCQRPQLRARAGAREGARAAAAVAPAAARVARSSSSRRFFGHVDR